MTESLFLQWQKKAELEHANWHRVQDLSPWLIASIVAAKDLISFPGSFRESLLLFLCQNGANICKQEICICTTLLFESYQKLQINSIPNRFKSSFSWVNYPVWFFYRFCQKSQAFAAALGNFSDSELLLRLKHRGGRVTTPVLQHCRRLYCGAWGSQICWAKIPQGILIVNVTISWCCMFSLIGAWSFQ